MTILQEMNFQPWRRSESTTKDDTIDIHSNVNNAASDSNTSNSTPGLNKPNIANNHLQQQQQVFPFTSRSLGQFNEDVSSAVLALVQVKQPEHEQVHEQVQQKISKFARPVVIQHNGSDSTSLQRQQIHHQDQLLQQMDAHRQLLLNAQPPTQQQQQQPQQQPLPQSQPPLLQVVHPQVPSHLIQPLGISQYQDLSQQSEMTKSSSSDGKMMSPVDRNGKVLNNTKRAAQNRNAQKLFRLRREQYVKDLEAEVRDVKTLRSTIDSLREENLQLRDYIITLQGKLLESGNGNKPTTIKDKQQQQQQQQQEYPSIENEDTASSRFNKRFLQDLSVDHIKNNIN